MKFWEKAFIVLLVVFVVAFNISIVVILHFTYQEELKNVERKASGEAYFIMSSITKDLNNMDDLDRLDTESVKNMLLNYMTY